MHIVIDARTRRSSTGRYVDRLLAHLQLIDRKNDYTILLAPNDTWSANATNFTPAPCPFSQFSLNPLQQFSFSHQLYKLKPDLVHFTMPQQPFFYSGKTVTTTHDLTILRFPRPKQDSPLIYWCKDRLYRQLLRRSLRKSTSIIVPSKFVAQDLATFQPAVRQKITVTYESSEPPVSGTSTPVVGVSPPFIMHAGSPLPHKNIARLVDAFRELKKSHPNLSLVLVGKPDFYFKKIAEGLADTPEKSSVIMPGFVSDVQLKWLYQQAEAYVLPSLSEGFGLPGLEAMSHDCPLVSSNATCLPEVYGDAAHYFNPEDVDDMAQKIAEVLDNKKLRADLIAEGKTQLKKYSWQRMATQTLDIYVKALNK